MKAEMYALITVRQAGKASRAAPVPGPLVEQGAWAAMERSGGSGGHGRAGSSGGHGWTASGAVAPALASSVGAILPPSQNKSLGEVEADLSWRSGGAGTWGHCRKSGLWRALPRGWHWRALSRSGLWRALLRGRHCMALSRS